jgi:DHA1 family multidrug resistance protein-like MFS transporter
MASARLAVWERNLRVLSAGQLVTMSAMGVVIPLIPFILRDLGMTDRASLDRWSGLVFSGPFLAAALMSPVWGHLGDRFGHKKMVVRAIVGLAAINLALVFVRTPAQFYAVRLAQGVVSGFVPAALAITAATTPRERMPDAMGKLAASAAAGRLVGPALGGLLAAVCTYRQLFVIVGLTIGVAAWFVTAYLREPPRAGPVEIVPWTAVLRRTASDRSLRWSVVGLLVTMIGISMTMPIFPLYVEGLTPGGVDPRVVTGVGFAVVAAFTLLTSLFLGRVSNRVGLKPLLVASLALAALALALHPHATRVVPMLALRALLGVAAAGIAPVLHAMVGRAAPEGMRGGVTGFANSATIFGFFAGPAGGGWIAARFGTAGTFRAAALVVLACGIAAAVAARRIGRDRAVPPYPWPIPR